MGGRHAHRRNRQLDRRAARRSAQRRGGGVSPTKTCLIPRRNSVPSAPRLDGLLNRCVRANKAPFRSATARFAGVDPGLVLLEVTDRQHELFRIDQLSGWFQVGDDGVARASASWPTRQHQHSAASAAPHPHRHRWPTHPPHPAWHAMNNKPPTMTQELLRNWVAALAMLSVVTLGAFLLMSFR